MINKQRIVKIVFDYIVNCPAGSEANMTITMDNGHKAYVTAKCVKSFPVKRYYLRLDDDFYRVTKKKASKKELFVCLTDFFNRLTTE